MKKRNRRKSGNRQKNREARNRSWRSVVFLAAIPALVYLVSLIAGRILYSPLFEIKRVVVDDPELDLSSFCGQNIFTVSLPEMVDRVRRDPWVAGLAVHRTFPAALHVSVVRRTPFAYLVLPNRRLLVTRDGKIVPEGKCAGLPTLEIHGLTPGELSAAIPSAVAVFDYCHSFVSLQTMSFLPYSLTLGLATGETVFLPRRFPEEKLPVLYRLLAEFRQKGLIYKYVDLRFDEPVFLPPPEVNVAGQASRL